MSGCEVRERELRPQLKRCKTDVEAFGMLKMMFQGAKDSKHWFAAWHPEQIENSMDGWRLLVTGHQRTKPPMSRSGAAAFGDKLRRTARRKAAIWYRSKLSVSDGYRQYLDKPKMLLENAAIS